jgi:hypothetical protein
MRCSAKYVGLDVHQSTTLATVRQASGKIIARSVLPTEEVALLEFFAGMRGPIHVAFEDGTQAQWLHDLLSPRVAREDPVIRALLQIPGIGVLSATALYASVGNIHAFKSGRHLASWLGLTPRESSSGERRRLGRITKQGDPYLRTLLIHGARSALLAAERARKAGRKLTHLQAWALERADEGHTNRAAVALANKLARIVWAVWRHDRQFDGDHALQLAAAA